MEDFLRRNRILALFCLFGFALPSSHFAFAQDTAELSLDDAVNYALEYNLSLRKIEIDLATSGYSERNLWAEIFPSINATASAGYRSSLFSGVQAANSGPNYSIGLGMSLGLNAGIPYAIRNIKLAHQSNILRYEDACNQLSIQITKIFYSLVAEKNNLLLLEEVLTQAQRQYTRSEISFRNGLVGELSLRQSSLALENARYNLSAARINHANNMTEFQAMLGMPYNADLSLLGEVNIERIEVDANSLIREHLPQRPDIVRASREIERLQHAQRQSVMQNRAPSLNLSMEWNSSTFDPFSDTLNATARLTIPIDSWIPGTSRQQTISGIESSIEKARLDLQITETSAQTQIRSLSVLLRNSWDSILIARLSLSAAERSYQLTEQGFLNGTVEALTLDDARNNMASARQRLLQSELSYFNMILDLSAALNTEWKNIIQTFGVQNEER
ncbi:MAG: TolC family protein [Treponema sp.]|jgi:multidrug efflux system outer membrane protein|nr:TolC family protein [Treponema sp.]